MPEIAIVTDTDASLPKDIVAKNGIYEVPITVHFGEEVLRTGIDINDTALFSRVDVEGKLPTTSAPSPGIFQQVFQQAFDDGAKSVICFTVSSEISATYGAAINAAELQPERDISVVDTRSLSLGQGYMVLAAVEAVQAGASTVEAITHAKEVGNRTRLFAALSTLKYLAMSGRVGYLAAGFGDLLNLKPILTIHDGKLDMLERVRTRRRAWSRLLTLTAEAIGKNSVEQMAVVHVDAREAALEFEAQLRINLPTPDKILLAELTPGLSVHTGSGLVGVSLVVGSQAA